MSVAIDMVTVRDGGTEVTTSGASTFALTNSVVTAGPASLRAVRIKGTDSLAVAIAGNEIANNNNARNGPGIDVTAGIGGLGGDIALDITDNVIASNKGLDEGGGLRMSPQASKITGSVTGNVIAGNTAGRKGAGIYAGISSSPSSSNDWGQWTSALGHDVALTLSNNIIVNNVASDSSMGVGGGVYAASAGGSVTTLWLTNNTISDNVTGADGGGVHASATNAGRTTLRSVNDIIWGNTAHRYGNDIFMQDDSGSGSTADLSLSHSIIGIFYKAGGAFTDAGGNTIADPLFVNLGAGNVHLMPGSPAINAGICANLPAPGTSGRIAPYKDVDGDERPGDGNFTGCDIGADQFATMAVPAGQRVFTYLPSVDPLIRANPSLARPLGVASMARDGDTLSLRVAANRFDGPVDIYLMIYNGGVSPEIHVIKADSSLQPLSAGLAAWRSNVLGPLDETLFGQIGIAGLPIGTYNVYVAVTPAGDVNSVYLWETSFFVPLIVHPLPPSVPLSHGGDNE